jgi:TfoX/Sxy family transcriptional regulator of competence genes
MAYDEGLAERLRQVTEGMPDVTEKRMFGGLAMMREGHMFVGIVDERLMARIGADAAETALVEPHVAPMDFTGRPMKDYVFVHPDGTASDADLHRWVDSAAAFVASLPPKRS